MGILEVHLHEPDFNFAPSVGGKGSETVEEFAESVAETAPETESEATDSNGGGRLAAIIGLLALIGIALAVRRFRGGRAGKAGEPQEQEYEERAST